MTSPASVIPGHAKAISPSSRPSAPRNTSDHQFLTSASSIHCSLTLGCSILGTCLVAPAPNRNFTGRGLLAGYRDFDFENAVIEIRGNLLGIGPLRQRNRPVEAAIPSFRDVNAVLLVLPQGLVLTFDDDGVLGNLESDVL